MAGVHARAATLQEDAMKHDADLRKDVMDELA